MDRLTVKKGEVRFLAKKEMLFLTVGVITMMMVSGPKLETGRNMYKAKIDDTYTINELYENYTNIKFLGDGIYTFEDKILREEG